MSRSNPSRATYAPPSRASHFPPIKVEGKPFVPEGGCIDCRQIHPKETACADVTVPCTFCSKPLKMGERWQLATGQHQ
jgi:hypothetical protein